MISRLMKTPVLWDLRRPFHLRLAADNAAAADLEPIVGEQGIGCGFVALLVAIAVVVLWFFGYGTYCAFANANFMVNETAVLQEHANMFLAGLVLQTLWWLPIPLVNFLLVVVGNILQMVVRGKMLASY